MKKELLSQLRNTQSTSAAFCSPVRFTHTFLPEVRLAVPAVASNSSQTKSASISHRHFSWEQVELPWCQTAQLRMLLSLTVLNTAQPDADEYLDPDWQLKQPESFLMPSFGLSAYFKHLRVWKPPVLPLYKYSWKISIWQHMLVSYVGTAQLSSLSPEL